MRSMESDPQDVRCFAFPIDASLVVSIAVEGGMCRKGLRNSQLMNTVVCTRLFVHPIYLEPSNPSLRLPSLSSLLAKQTVHS